MAFHFHPSQMIDEDYAPAEYSLVVFQKGADKPLIFHFKAVMTSLF